MTVLGSLNMDVSVTVPRLPGPGMSVLGGAARFAPGGKGANQAVAAARLGARVRMIGTVGGDDFGRQLTEALRAEGVDARSVRSERDAPSGLAMITVDTAGENMITVAPGANRRVGEYEVGAIADSGYDALVISAEIPVPAIVAAVRLSGTTALRGKPCILNLAPVPAEAAAIVSEGVDWLVVNESEAAALLERPVGGLADARQAALALTGIGARNAVVTAGAHGAAVAGQRRQAQRPEILTVPGLRVTAVDTVGAGDTFVGALAVTLAAGVPVPDAVRAAVAAGAAAVTRPGAQAGMPRPADVKAATGLTWPTPRALI